MFLKINETKDAQAFLKYAFTRPHCEFSYTNHICVLVDDEVVGIGAVYSGAIIKKFTFYAIRYIFAFYGFWTGLKVLIRGLKIEKIIPPPEGNTAYFAHLGIHPKLRGKGLGSKMITHFTQLAHQQKRDSLSLDVSAENPKAQALYERLGFEVTKKHPSSLKHQYSYVADHYKMFKAL